MSHIRPLSCGPVLLALWIGLMPAQAAADTTVMLDGVTFSDGGTASGYFDLNVYGYLDAAAITTTPGTSQAHVPLAGYTYGLAGSGVPAGPLPFDSIFSFGSTADAFVLVLTAQDAISLTGSGFVPLVPGSTGVTTLAGSYEACTENAAACGGPSYQDGRLLTAGALYVPEPAAFSILALAMMTLSLLRRGG
jgi:hypothetical protein